MERSDGIEKLSVAGTAAQKQPMISRSKGERRNVDGVLSLQPALTFAQNLDLEPAAAAALDVHETARVERVDSRSK